MVMAKKNNKKCCSNHTDLKDETLKRWYMTNQTLQRMNPGLEKQFNSIICAEKKFKM